MILVYHSHIQTTLVVAQMFVYAIYLGFAIVGSMGNCERFAELYLQNHEWIPLIQQMKNNGEIFCSGKYLAGSVLAALAVALIYAAVIIFNCFIASLLDKFAILLFILIVYFSLNNYLKLRSDYYKLIHERVSTTV